MHAAARPIRRDLPLLKEDMKEGTKNKLQNVVNVVNIAQSSSSSSAAAAA